ncbi:MAG: DUF3109 family protein [Ignavibacteriales bacterium]|nr:DUF3109 family protein [Ignavibacteriales bacterium]
MADSSYPILRTHKLAHIPALKVDPVVFNSRFQHGCSMINCNATCCAGGVLLDIEERDNILHHVDLIHRHMEPGQIKDPAAWFDVEVEEDADYPSGKGTGTQTTEKGCVFLKHDGRCVLQTAAMEEGLPKDMLKPFFCFAFPVTIDGGVLTIDDPDLANRPECCSMIPGGTVSVLDLCAEEFEFVLGSEGAKALRELAPPHA